MRLKKAFGISVKTAAILLITLSSCNQQLYRGYGYKGSTGAPDVRNERSPQPDLQPQNLDESLVPADQHALASQADQQALVRRADQPATKAFELEPAKQLEPAMHQILLEEAEQLAVEGKEINHRNLTKNLTQRLTEEGQVPAISPAQERKMSRLAAKMDKKMKKEGKEIDWRHNSNLELFFMIMSIAGLVLGIIGVGIGWFVFIVFAGIWLYFKLVKD